MQCNLNTGITSITKEQINNQTKKNWLLIIGYWNLFVPCILVIGD